MTVVFRDWLGSASIPFHGFTLSAVSVLASAEGVPLVARLPHGEQQDGSCLK